MSEANGESPRGIGSVFPPVLDVCCGARMFWFTRSDGRALFVDKRRERVTYIDRGKVRHSDIDPDLLCDFSKLPFRDETFALVVFDPPHLKGTGPRGWMRLKYGGLDQQWEEMLRAGFSECFRVLKPHGTLCFKWSTVDVPLRRVLALTPVAPLFGNRNPKLSKTHWCVFLKPNDMLTVDLRAQAAGVEA